jgi:hypothetical protein
MSRDAVRDNAEPHLSVSQAKQCLAKTAFERIAGLREAPSAAMEFGSYIHALAECYYLGRPAPAESDLNAREKARALALIYEYISQIGAQIRRTDSLLVEHRFELRTWTRRPIFGYIDLAYALAMGQTRVADIKTKGTPPTAVRDDERLQLATYVAALDIPRPARAELHVLVTAEDPEVYMLDALIEESDVAAARERFQELDAAYESRRFRPEPSYQCRYCLAFAECREGETFSGDIDAWMAKRKKEGAA